VEPVDVFSRLDKMFDEWTRSWPLYGGFEARWPRLGAEVIRVDEYREGSTVVIRAELPGIDPDEDVELTLAEGMLRIEAQRRTEETEEEKGYVRRELRYGSFARTLPLPEGVSDSDISASYQDGILEIRIALPEAAKPPEPKQVPVSRS
jgi:HSP20 family protein